MINWTKEKLITMWNWLYKRYVDLLRKYLKLKRESTVYMGKWNKEQPTQRNKPSAHSSLTKSEAKSKLRSKFPYPKYQIFYVSNTNSMEPFIDANSIVLCEKVTDEVLAKQPLVKGDICIYRADAPIGGYRYIIHRIVDVREKDGEKQYKFLGDNNFWSDGWVRLDQIKWRYVGQLQTRQLEEGD